MIYNSSMVIELSKLSQIFKALSNEQRLRIFQMIAHKDSEHCGNKRGADCCQGMEKAFSKACACLGVSKSTISHHIKELNNASLINCEKKGQINICSVNKELLENIKLFFNKL